MKLAAGVDVEAAVVDAIVAGCDWVVVVVVVVVITVVVGVVVVVAGVVVVPTVAMLGVTVSAAGRMDWKRLRVCSSERKDFLGERISSLVRMGWAGILSWPGPAAGWTREGRGPVRPRSPGRCGRGRKKSPFLPLRGAAATVFRPALGISVGVGLFVSVSLELSSITGLLSSSATAPLLPSPAVAELLSGLKGLRRKKEFLKKLFLHFC